MATQENGHNVQFVERITKTNKGVRSHFLKDRKDHELREEPNALEARGTVSDPQPNALGQYEPVSRWTNEVAQTQDMESIWPPQKDQEMTRAGISGPSPLSALEMVVLQFLSISQQCGAIVKVQFGNEPVIACHFRAAEQLTEFNQQSDERGRCLPLVPTSQSKQAAVESYEVNRPITQENMKSTDKLHIAPARSQSKKVDVAGVV